MHCLRLRIRRNADGSAAAATDCRKTAGNDGDSLAQGASIMRTQTSRIFSRQFNFGIHPGDAQYISTRCPVAQWLRGKLRASNPTVRKPTVLRVPASSDLAMRKSAPSRTRAPTARHPVNAFRRSRRALAPTGTPSGTRSGLSNSSSSVPPNRSTQS